MYYSGLTVGAEYSEVSFPPEDDLPLSHYGVHDESTLFLTRSCGCIFFEIYVEWVVGRLVDIISLRVAPGDSVYSIKRLLQEKMDITVDQQSLLFEGVPLEDNDELHDCRIIGGSTIDLRVA